VLLSKCDKLTRSEATNTLRLARQKVGDAILFSSLKGDGVEEARGRIAAWIPRDDPT